MASVPIYPSSKNSMCRPSVYSIVSLAVIVAACAIWLAFSRRQNALPVAQHETRSWVRPYEKLREEALQSVDMEKRLQAIVAIPDSTGYKGTTLLLGLLSDKSAKVRHAAAMALIQCRRDPRVLPALYAYFSEQNPLTRQYRSAEEYVSEDAALLKALVYYPPFTDTVKAYVQDAILNRKSKWGQKPLFVQVFPMSHRLSLNSSPLTSSYLIPAPFISPVPVADITIVPPDQVDEGRL